MKVGFIGIGVMGGAIMEGLLAAGQPADDVLITDARAERVDDVAATFGVRAAEPDEIAQADAVVVAVKPQDLVAALPSGPSFGADTVIISIAAGVPTSTIEGVVGQRPVVRVMPNTPAQIGAGMSVLSPGAYANEDHVARARDVLAGSGATVVIAEGLQEAATAVSGSGPAYFFYLVEAMIDAGVGLGLPRDVATQLATQTAVGASRLLAESGERASLLRERVTSPGGSTAAALETFDDRAMRAAITAGMRAVVDRTRELGRA